MLLRRSHGRRVSASEINEHFRGASRSGGATLYEWGMGGATRHAGHAEREGTFFFTRDGKGFGFGAPAAGFSTDFHDPWRMVVGDGEGAHRVSSIMPVCNMQGPTVLSARDPYSRSPRLYELANRYTLSR